MNSNIIYPNKKNKFSLYKIITFDTESKRYNITNKIERQTMYNCDFYDGNKHYYTENINTVKNTIYELFKKYEQLTFFAHNIVYDLRILHLLDSMIEDKLFNLDSIIKLMDNVFFVKFSSKNRRFILQFADSQNYFKTKLENLAELLGKEKENVNEYKYPKNVWNDVLLESGKRRVQTDTELLYSVLEKFINNNDFDLSFTLAGSAFKTFKMRYLKDRIYFPRLLIPEAMDSYLGGIVLPYKLIKNMQLYYYDINSLYPYVMNKNLYSIRFNKKIDNYKYIYDDIKNRAYNYLVKVKYSIPNWSPVYANYDNNLIPFLENEKWITGNELLELYNNNATIIIEEAYEFINDDIFSDFVNYFYNKRLLTKDYEKFFYKIFLNSLYGKFGQHKGHSFIIKIKDIEDFAEQNEILIAKNEGKERFILNDKMISIYDTFITYLTQGDVKYSPMIASEITANARIVNFRYSQMFGFEHLYYTDTDSFMIDKEYPELISKELGKLKLEKSGLFTIYAPKDYEYYGNCGECDNCYYNGKSWHTTLKGVRDKDTINGNTYLNYRWSKLKYPSANDIYIEEEQRNLYRINKKIKYVTNIGSEWKNIDEYNLYNEIRLPYNSANKIEVKIA